MKRKFFSAAACFAALTLLLCSCSKVSYIYEKAAEDTVNLRLCWNWSDSGVKSDTFTEIINSFAAKNPSVNIESEFSGNDTFYQKLQIDFASNNAPDILSTRPGNTINRLMGASMLADLSEIYEKNDGRLKKMIEHNSLSTLSQNGKIYGIPFEKKYVFLYVNKDIFSFCGAKIPTTFSELEDAVSKIRSNNIIPIAFSASDDYLYQAIVGRLSGSELEQTIKNGVPSDAYKNGIEFLKHLQQLGAFPKNFISASQEEAAALFTTKKAAMIMRDSGFISTIYSSGQGSSSDLYDSETTPFKIVCFPQANEFSIGSSSVFLTSYLSGLGDATFFASAKSFENPAKKNALEDFFEYLTKEANVSLLLENGKFDPAVTITPDSKYYSPLTTQLSLNILAAHEFLPMPDLIAPESIWNRDIVDKMPLMFLNEISPDEMVNTLFEDIK